MPHGPARGDPVRGGHRSWYTHVANRADQLHRPTQAQGRQPPPGDARRLRQAHRRGRPRTPPRRSPARSPWASICRPSAPRPKPKAKAKAEAEEAKKFTVRRAGRSVAAVGISTPNGQATRSAPSAMSNATLHELAQDAGRLSVTRADVQKGACEAFLRAEDGRDASGRGNRIGGRAVSRHATPPSSLKAAYKLGCSARMSSF